MRFLDCSRHEFAYELPRLRQAGAETTHATRFSGCFCRISSRPVSFGLYGSDGCGNACGKYEFQHHFLRISRGKRDEPCLWERDQPVPAVPKR